MIFEPLPTNCDLSVISMEEAALRLGPSFVYDLYVHPEEMFCARNMLKQLLCNTRDNPFAPYVNLASNHFRKKSTWVLCANGRRIGSEGVC